MGGHSLTVVSANPLYRYWMVPSFWRRWPALARMATLTLCIAVSLLLAGIPLFVWLPNKSWQGWDGYSALLFYMGFLILLSFFLTLAGSLTIAPEHERQTWESLYLTPLGVPAVVRAKLLCRLIRCGSAILLTLPFWVAWGYEVLTINKVGPVESHSSLSPVRLSIFLSWLSLRTVGHMLPCVAVGMLISAYSRKARTAMSLACSAVVAYGSLAWGLSSMPGLYLSSRQVEVCTKLIWWPTLPVEWQNYDAGSLVSTSWNSDVMADVVWMALIPALCYWLTVRRCRRLSN